MTKEKKLRKFYDMGYSDSQLMRKLNISKYQVKRWREENKLKNNSKIDLGVPMEEALNEEQVKIMRNFLGLLCICSAQCKKSNVKPNVGGFIREYREIISRPLWMNKC